MSEHVPQGMADLSGFAGIGKDSGQVLGQTHLTIDSLEQQSATVAGNFRLIEGDDCGLGNEFWKKNRLFCRIAHDESLFEWCNCLW
ncbi:hypothetical protein CSB20_04645 [bacterium DOLZORAL124_64_63]|nr:MAG: hypothetical protein CSB20_04645 [bacterium DOLZORAL124_64_63]